MLTDARSLRKWGAGFVAVVLLTIVALAWLLWPRLPVRGVAPQRFAAPPAPTDAAWRVAESALSPVPRGGTPITPENAGQLTEVARWGAGQARALRYSPDGSLLAVESDLGVYLYDAETLDLVRWIQTEDSVDSAAFSPDSTMLALVVDHRIQLRSVADGSMIRTLDGHDYIQQLAFSPNGALLASGAWDDTVRLWSVTDGSLVRTFGHDDYVWSVAFHPDGEHVASASTDGTVRVWRVSDGTEVRAFGKPFLLDFGHIIGNIDSPFRYDAVAFSPDGRSLVASSSNYYTYVWAFPSGRLVQAMETDSTSETLTFGANTTLFNRSGEQWDLGRRQLVRAIDGITFEPMSVAPSHDGSRVAMLEWAGRIVVWDTGDGAFHMGLRPEEAEAVPHACLLLAADGETLVAGDEAGQVQLRRLPEGEMRHALARGSAPVSSVALSPDGTLVAGGTWYTMTSLGGSGDVTVWRVADGAALYELRGHHWIEDLEFSPDGRFLATAGADERNAWPIRVWDMADGQLLHELDGHEFTVEALRFVGSDRLLSASSDYTVRLWDVVSGALIETREGFRFFNYHEFSADGAILAGTTGDYTFEIRRVEDGELLHELHQTGDGVGSLAFSPDGALIATGSMSGTLRLWNVADGKLLHTLPGHAAWLTTIAFSGDGAMLLTSGHDGTTRFWSVPAP